MKWTGIGHTVISILAPLPDSVLSLYFLDSPLLEETTSVLAFFPFETFMPVLVGQEKEVL